MDYQGVLWQKKSYIKAVNSFIFKITVTHLNAEYLVHYFQS